MISAEYLPSNLNVKADWEPKYGDNVRMVTITRDVSENQENIRPTWSRLACIKTLPSTTIIHRTEEGSNYHHNKCSASELEQSSQLCFPSTFSFLSQILNKVMKNQVNQVIVVTLVCQTQLWYPQLLKMSIVNQALLPQKKQSLTESAGEEPSINWRNVFQDNDMESPQEQLLCERKIKQSCEYEVLF